MSKIDTMVQWAIDFANDNSHGYSQTDRWGTDADCSSLVIRAAEAAGFPVRSYGASYTGNMKYAFLKSGFSDVKESVNIFTGAGLKKGDILLNEIYHTALMISPTQLVQAVINELGTVTGGRPGDQTGIEISIGAYYAYGKGWDCVLRYTEGENDYIPVYPAGVYAGAVPITWRGLPTLTKGSTGDAVKAVQYILLARGGKLPKYGADGDFGDETLEQVKQYQKDHNLTPDGAVGRLTWEALTDA